MVVRLMDGLLAATHAPREAIRISGEIWVVPRLNPIVHIDSAEFGLETLAP